uniref:SH2 domain-containing protein n=1 Tax=Mesocestoides corti TaxID=53468 RepID=A0A5K3F0L4_MESCO
MDVEIRCNGRGVQSGKPSLVSSGLRRQWLDSTNGDSTDEGPAQADKSENSGARQRALSDPKAPPHPLLQPIRHSVAFFESPPAPKLAEDLQAPPPPSIPIASVSIKDKHRAIFDFPLGDHPISSTAASPVVVLKAHLDSLAEDAKKQAKQPLKKPETPSGAASRFRLRQGVGGGKKRQLERPLSQIICQLDSALLLNNSPSFSVQPRSEERLSAMEPTTSNTSNSHSAFEEEEESGEQLSSMMEPPTSATVEKDCDGVDGPPIPPVRVHSLRRGGGGSCGGDFRHSSSGASPHVARRGVATPLQSLNKSPGGGEETAWNFETDTKADDSPRRNLRLADVCPVPNVTYPGALMDLATYVPGASVDFYPRHDGCHLFRCLEISVFFSQETLKLC